MFQSPEGRSDASIERHIQTILVSIATGAIVFASTYFFKDSADKATTNQQLVHLNTQVAELRAEIRTMQASYVTKEVALDHETRIRNLERKVLR